MLNEGTRLSLNGPIFVFDTDLKVEKIAHWDASLWFNCQKAEELIGLSLLQWSSTASTLAQKQVRKIFKALEKASLQKRSLSISYRSMGSSSLDLLAVGHIIWQEEGSLCLQLMALEEDDETDPEIYSVLDALPIGLELLSPEGKIRYINEVNCHILGMEGGKNTIRQGLSVYDNPILPKEVKEKIRRQEDINVRFLYDCSLWKEGINIKERNGEKIFIECLGRPIFKAEGDLSCYAIILREVTQEVKAEIDLQEGRKKMAIAMQYTDIILWEFDSRTGMFRSENEPINHFQDQDFIKPEDYHAAFHPEDVLASELYIEKMKKGVEKLDALEVRIRYPDNLEWQYCVISGTPFERDADGTVVRYVGFRRNNTMLQKQKQLREKVLNSIPLPINLKDVENGFKYVFCNDEFKRVFDASENDSTCDVLSADQVEKVHQIEKEVYRTGKPYFSQERLVLHSGQVCETLVRKSVIEEGGKRMLLNLRWDQTEQNELKRRSKILSVSMAAMKAYTWCYDRTEDTLTFGDGFDQTGGNPIALSRGRAFSETIYPADKRESVRTMVKMLKAGAGSFIMELRRDFRGEGKYEWWESRGVVETVMRNNNVPSVYMFGMEINIEERKQTELRLLENERALDRMVRQNKLILDNINSSLAYISANYVVQWENVSSFTNKPYNTYEKGEFCYKNTHAKTQPCEECMMKKAMVSGQMEKMQFALSNGSTVEIFATPVYGEEEKIDGVVLRIDDITERETIITELKKAKKMAEQSDRLKSAFLANMSHEIRTPLNAIVGFSDLLVGCQEVQTREEYMNLIRTNNEILLKLINDILDLSKIEAGFIDMKYTEFDLSAFFNELAASLKQRVTNSRLTLLVNNPYDKYSVCMDKGRFAQIVTNYVTNAIKYTPVGQVEMGYQEEGGAVRIYVKDTGIGIENEKKKRVFQRFEKLDEFAQGTGLGLFICKTIAEALGGSVGFESQEGVGSTFWAVLPCRKDDQDPSMQKLPTEVDMNPSVMPKENASSPQDASLGKAKQEQGKEADLKTIIVAEDIESNYMLVYVILSKKYHIIHAQNGLEAVEAVGKGMGDLVLMDMKMPVMDGLTATAEIRKINAKIPIVALTAHAFESDKIAAMEAGCNDYLVKPIDRRQLLDLLFFYLGR